MLRPCPVCQVNATERAWCDECEDARMAAKPKRSGRKLVKRDQREAQPR